VPSRARQSASRVTAAPFQCRLVILAKAPVAGDVKTRLAREVGVTAATRFYRHAMASVIARLGSQPFWHTVIAAAPEAALRSAIWPAGMHRVSQGRGDIGRRMQQPMRRFPPGPVCVIGTDIPDIEVDHLRRAFRLLGRRDVVFGPAEDGGFWLVGMRRRPRVPDPYSRVRWSSPHALGDTLSNLAGLSVGFTATLHDVDTAGDLRRVAARFGRRVRPPSRF
jgi:rSAM/selenodomain-associated transferase 1